MNAQIQHNFKYQPPLGDAGASPAVIRAKAEQLAAFIDELLPPAAGREKAVAITKCEEAMFWACAGITRHSQEKSA